MNGNKKTAQKNKTVTKIQMSFEDRFSDFQMKFYAEQTKYFNKEYFDGLSKSDALKYQKECIDRVLDHIPSSPKLSDRVEGVGVLHDDDEKTPHDVWESAKDKPHAHIYIRSTVKSGQRRKQLRPSTVARSLGIVYNRPEDASLWANGGLQKIVSWESCMLYTTHETEAAMQDPHKKIYRVSRVYRNFSKKKFEQYRDIAKAGQNVKVTSIDIARLEKEAFTVGYELGDFFEFKKTLPYNLRKSSADINQLREDYDDGIKAHMNKNKNVTRCAIFIQGEKNYGKTHGVMKALEGLRVLECSNGGTGQLDLLTPVYDALVLNDSKFDQRNLMSCTADEFSNVYHRNKNNSVFAGRYFIVTSNLSFLEWVESCGFKARIKVSKEVPEDPEEYIYTEEYDALCSRFFICQIQMDEVFDEPRLICSNQKIERGSDDRKSDKQNLYITFRKAFNESIAEYYRMKKDSSFHMVDLNYDQEELEEREIALFIKESSNAKYALEVKEHNKTIDEIIRQYSDEWFDINNNIFSKLDLKGKRAFLHSESGKHWEYIDKLQRVFNDMKM